MKRYYLLFEIAKECGATSQKINHWITRGLDDVLGNLNRINNRDRYTHDQKMIILKMSEEMNTKKYTVLGAIEKVKEWKQQK